MYKIIGADQKEYGPVTADQLRTWIAEGRADSRTLLQAEGGAWKPLSTFPEFADAFRAQPTAAPDQDVQIIPSPIVGTFYRSPSPNADPFVKIGSNVEQDTVVCIIEAMKLMNEIQAEAAGEVVKIYVENGQPVEYGQPLFGIKS